MYMNRRLAYGCLALATLSGCSTTTRISDSESAPTPVMTTWDIGEPLFPTVEEVDEHTDGTFMIPDNTAPSAVATEQADRVSPPATTSIEAIIATTQPNQQTGRVCTKEQAESFSHRLLDPYGIPIPVVTMIEGTSGYPVGSTRIEIEYCDSESAVAHEIGHYVHSLANGLDYNRIVSDAAARFSSGWWIKGRELAPGIEYAAHCIGNVLFDTGSYTKCPSDQLRSQAAEVISLAIPES